MKFDNIENLNSILLEKGKNSVEFFNGVKKFIVYIHYRHLGWSDEDLMNNSYMRIVESLGHFNHSKGNLGTFIYSVVRNEVTKRLYQDKKYFVVQESREQSSDDDSTPPLEMQVVWVRRLKRMKMVRLSDTFIRRIVTKLYRGEVDTWTKSIMWENRM